MGPKKKDNFRNKNEKCEHYNRGYCRNGERCQEHHPDKVCPDSNCFDEKCPHRHPNPCKFGRRCVFNKKKICCYSHVTLVSDDAKKMEEMEKRLTNLEKEKQVYNDAGKKMERKCEVLENKMELLRKTVCRKRK